MMYRRLLNLILGLLLSTGAWATHVLGGEMYYDKLGGDQYRVTLKLYRDCGPGNTNGTAFDPAAKLVVFDGNGAQQFTIDVPFTGEQTVPVELNNPCLGAPPSICATWTEYITIVDLPPNTTGYVISYQRCCRTPTIANLPTGLLQGLTCTVQIPPSGIGANSSPRFNDYPPIAMCMGEDMIFDHSATDPDGDSLVYDLFTPFQGADDIDPAPYAPPPPYFPIVWAAGYSGSNPMDGAPPMAVDPITGELTVHPTLLGSFAVGVRVREYRNGVLLSASIRDLRFDVVLCDITIIANVQGQSVEQLCSGKTVEPINESVNGQFYHWDFGVQGILTDTSNLEFPTWTYADTGSYNITLIANPGWPCADTTVSIFNVYLPLDPYFARPPIRCPDQPAEFVAEGNLTTTTVVSWDLGTAGSPEQANGVAISAGFSELGGHPVVLTLEDHGCTATYADSVVVYPRIVMDLVTDRAGCEGTTFLFNGTAEAWTPVQFAWDFGDGETASEPELEHLYVGPGLYDVTLNTWTVDGCIDQANITLPNWVEVFPIPVADFAIEPATVSLLDPRVQVVDHSQLAQEWSYQIEGRTVTTPSFDYMFDDAGRFNVMLTVTSGENCSDTITHTVFVTDHLFYAPNAFTPDGDGLNDTFAPVVKGARLYEIFITDRWGIERFRSTDPKAEWSGDGLPQGVYGYQVRIAEHGAYRKEYKGSVTLLR